MPQILSPRIMRWMVFLASYNYHLTDRPGKTLSHADALSLCSLPTSIIDPTPVSSVLLVEDLAGPLTASDIAKHIAHDKILACVLDWVRRGWPMNKVPAEFQPYWNRQHELSVLKCCLLWGSRMLIPSVLRVQILKCLHEAHPGVVRMKALGRSYVWWPGLDEEITQWVARCQECQLSRAAHLFAPVREWETPRLPWS